MAGPKRGPTFDPQVLIELTGNSLRTVARRIGVDPAMLCRRMSPATADRYAVACGYHPSEVWGAAWFAAAPAEPDENEDEDEDGLSEAEVDEALAMLRSCSPIAS